MRLLPGVSATHDFEPLFDVLALALCLSDDAELLDGDEWGAHHSHRSRPRRASTGSPSSPPHACTQRGGVQKRHTPGSAPLPHPPPPSRRPSVERRLAAAGSTSSGGAAGRSWNG